MCYSRQICCVYCHCQNKPQKHKLFKKSNKIFFIYFKLNVTMNLLMQPDIEKMYNVNVCVCV